MRGWGKVWIAAGVSAVILWMIWPYYSVLSLIGAVRDKDAARVEHKVDWPSLREGLRNDLNAMMLLQARRSGGNETDAMAVGLLAAIGPAMVNSMVDAYVTPSGLAALFAGERPANIPEGAVPGAIKPASDLIDGRKDFDIRRVEYAFFTGPLTFQVDMATDAPGMTVSAVFHWRGRWKLTRFVFPIETFANPPPKPGAQAEPAGQSLPR